MSENRQDIGPDCPQLVLPHDNATLLANHNALELTVQNIKVHFDMLCTHELRQHGFVSPDHDIDFQVFRVLCGYKELMDSHNALVEAVAWERECGTVSFTDLWFDEWNRTENQSHSAMQELRFTRRASRTEVDRLIDDCKGEG